MRSTLGILHFFLALLLGIMKVVFGNSVSKFGILEMVNSIASTEFDFNSVFLEVLRSRFRVDTVRGESRTWFASVFTALTSRLVLETDKR